MTQPTLVKDLFIRPDAVRKNDFVLKLTEGVSQAEKTVQEYVVTPGILDALGRALGLVESALSDSRSKGAYLHGSFGSGKSHFMAVLSLLLQGDEHAWGKGELHELRTRYPEAGRARLLELHFHMIGKKDLESAIFGRYVDYVKDRHPGAPTPPVFADDALFDNAREMRAKLGDESFFKRINEGEGEDAPAGDDDWGDFGAGDWTPERFDSYANSSSPRERAELFDVLTKTWFSAYTSQGAFVDLDSGLAEMARHAKTLGYDGIVLFLDELILWLAHRASEKEWMHGEVQKMVKLVEAEESIREIPIVSFIARQRDLSEMVGDDYAGLEAKRLRDSLRHWEGRFDTVDLEDSNLPAIVEKRVLKPKSGAETELERAFAELKKSAGASWQTLLGEWDQAAFRKLYPFSPALVDALVALSGFLQRERTAIRLLMEILVSHIEDLQLGEVVRVGDLFDAMIVGADAADGAQRARFNAAKELYEYKFLPLIQEQNQTNNPERCQRERPGHRVRLGCAGCLEKQCRNDNRLIKTLLIAALVPNVSALKDLTASRLVALNHGSIRVPIPGTEAARAATTLRKWNSELTQIHVGGENDPSVRVRLESVDALDILKRAKDLDSDGARRRVVRAVLFEALGVDTSEAATTEFKVKSWRGTTRVGDLAFGNVRKLHPDQIRCRSDAAFRLVVDYPFDEPGFGPNADHERLEELVESSDPGWTLVWLPSFFSQEMNNLVGDLAVLETLLSTSANVKQYTSHLPVDQQSRARHDLENLQNAKRNRLEQVLEQAYGLKASDDGDLDPSLRVTQHLWLLKPGARYEQPRPASLATALDAYLPALLAARWPRHPQFAKSLSRRKAEDLIQAFNRLLETESKELELTRAELDEFQGTLGALGIVQVTERVVRLNQGTGLLSALEKDRNKEGIDAPSARQVRSWIDRGGKMGLLPDIEDLILRCYARRYARTFVVHDRAYAPTAGSRIPDDVILEKPPLPSEDDWRKALALAAGAFGVSLPGKALHADNLKAVEEKLREPLSQFSRWATRLPPILAEWCAEFGVDGEVHRAITAKSADTLCAELAGKSGKLLVEALAAFTPETSARAIGGGLTSAQANVEILENPLVRAPLSRLNGDLSAAVGAAELRENLQAALRQDEINQALSPRLRQLAEAVQELASATSGSTTAQPAGGAQTSPPAGVCVTRVSFDELDSGEVATRLRSLADELDAESGRCVRGTLEIWKQGES